MGALCPFAHSEEAAVRWVLMTMRFDVMYWGEGSVVLVKVPWISAVEESACHNAGAAEGSRSEEDQTLPSTCWK